MDRFLFIATLPETVVSGQMTCQSAAVALSAVESMYPDAIELHIRKQKPNARDQAIGRRKEVYRRAG
jgi:hypothetical protein